MRQNWKLFVKRYFSWYYLLLNFSKKEEEINISSAHPGFIKRFKQFIRNKHYKLIRWIFHTFFVINQQKVLTAEETLILAKNKIIINLEFDKENQDESILEDIKIYLKDPEVILPMGSSRKLFLKSLDAIL